LCGLIGVMGKHIPEPVKKTFFDMLTLDALRGDDSTGVAAISNTTSGKLEVELFKSLGGPSEFFYEHTNNKRNRNLTYKLVNVYMGHNRFATQGKISEENAHPFDFENVVGAHNGTLSMSSLKDFHGFKDFDIDSKIVFSHLSHTKDINDVWKEADGAMALSWFDKIDKKLHLIRNKDRPLYFGYTKNDQQVFWASEKWMIYIAANRQGVEILEPVGLKDNTLYTFGINDANKVFHTEEAISPFVPKPVVNHYQQNYYDDWLEQSGTKNSSYKPVVKNNHKGSLNNSLFIITEFHDIPDRPVAFGHLMNGKSLRINIPLVQYAKAKEKILEAGKTKGFFRVETAFKAFGQDGEYWCMYDKCSFIKLKPHMSVVRRDDNSFCFKQTNEIKLEYAPYFKKGIFLTLSSYVEKTKCGCFNCQTVPMWPERDTLTWMNDKDFVCKDCVSLPVVKEFLVN